MMKITTIEMNLIKNERNLFLQAIKEQVETKKEIAVQLIKRERVQPIQLRKQASYSLVRIASCFCLTLIDGHQFHLSSESHKPSPRILSISLVLKKLL